MVRSPKDPLNIEMFDQEVIVGIEDLAKYIAKLKGESIDKDPEFQKRGIKASITKGQYNLPDRKMPDTDIPVYLKGEVQDRAGF